MPNRPEDHVVWVVVTEQEWRSLQLTAIRRGLTVAGLVRRAVNEMELEDGDELVWLEERRRGGPRKPRRKRQAQETAA